MVQHYVNMLVINLEQHSKHNLIIKQIQMYNQKKTSIIMEKQKIIKIKIIRIENKISLMANPNSQDHKKIFNSLIITNKSTHLKGKHKLIHMINMIKIINHITIQIPQHQKILVLI